MRDQAYLRRVQYRDDSNLNARAELHRRFTTSPPGDFHHWLLDQMDLPSAATVLDVGCGPGYIWRANADRLPDGWSVVLADLSAGMVTAARERLGPRFRYAAADAAALPFASGAFDAVLAHHMLYHVADRTRAIRELARLLRPNGSLYAATNGQRHLRELDQLASGHWRSDQLGPEAHAFRLENGADQLAIGFTAVELRRRPGELAVTEVEPVVAYIRSMSGGEVDLGPLRHEVAGIIERDGAFRSGTDTGLFVARSPIQSRS
jgi:SAM-dependent methyltransferase